MIFFKKGIQKRFTQILTINEIWFKKKRLIILYIQGSRELQIMTKKTQHPLEVEK